MYFGPLIDSSSVFDF